MSRVWVAAVLGLAVTVGAAGAASAVGAVQRSLDPAEQTVDGGAPASVTYTGCIFGQENVGFTLEGTSGTLTVACSNSGTATANFTAPMAPGTYNGTATPIFLDVLTEQAGLRSPIHAMRSDVGRLAPQQVPKTCPDTGACTFTVTVRAPATTTTTTLAPTTTPAPTTTLAPTTTPAPTTTAVGAVAPTTTAQPAARPVLPATGPSQTDNTSTIALVLLALGGLLVVATRMRKGNAPG